MIYLLLIYLVGLLITFCIYLSLYFDSKYWDDQDEVIEYAEKAIHSYRYPIWIVKVLIELRKDSKLGY